MFGMKRDILPLEVVETIRKPLAMLAKAPPFPIIKIGPPCRHRGPFIS